MAKGMAEGTNMSTTIRRFAGGLALVSAGLLGVASAGCNWNEAGQDIGQAKRTAEFYGGMYVTVMGELEHKIGPNLFKIENDELIEDELWVVAPGGQGAGLEDDNEVLVTGTMQQISVVEIEREYGLDLDAELEAEFEDRVIMVADQVSSLQDTAALSPPDAYGIDAQLEDPIDGELYEEESPIEG